MKNLSFLPVTGVLLRPSQPWAPVFSVINYFFPIEGLAGGKESIIARVFNEWLGDYANPHIFRRPYRVDEIKKVLSGLKNTFGREGNKAKELNNISLLNHVSYHILNPQFLEIASQYYNLTDFIEVLFRRMDGKRKDNSTPSLIFDRILHILLFNYALVGGSNSLGKNKFFKTYLLRRSIEDFRGKNDDFVEHCGCSLLYVWETIFLIVNSRTKRSETRYHDFLKFHKRIKKTEFDRDAFLTNTLMPIFVSNYAKRKKFAKKDHQYFCLHPYILLYDLILRSMTGDSRDLTTYFKAYVGRPRLMISILQDLNYFFQRIFSDKNVEQLTRRTRPRVYPVDFSVSSVLLLRIILVMILRMCSRRIISEQLLTVKYTQFITKKCVAIHNASRRYLREFGEEDNHDAYLVFPAITLNMFFEMICNTKTSSPEIRVEVLKIAGDLISKHMKDFSRQTIDVQEQLSKIITILMSPMIEHNENDEWWKENGMDRCCEQIIQHVFFSDDDAVLSLRNPRKPITSAQEVSILLYSSNLISWVCKGLSVEEFQDFVFSEVRNNNNNDNNKNMCLFEKMLLAYYKGPTRLKHSIANQIVILTSTGISVFEPMRIFFEEKKKKKKYCDVDLLLQSLRKEENECMVVEHKTTFRRAIYYLEMNILRLDMKKNAEFMMPFGKLTFLEDMFRSMSFMENEWRQEMMDSRLEEEESEEEEEETDEKMRRGKEKERLRKSGLSNATKDCGYCHAHFAGKMCSRCQSQRYCSSKCQKKHWKVHKLECTPP